MIDLTRLKLVAGDGGDGRISLLREKFRPKGGPDGGDGGKGGSIIFEVDENLNTLKSFAGIREVRAKNGEPGGKNKRHGADSDDLIIKVPAGTVVWLEAENEPSRRRRKRYEQSLAEFDFDQETDKDDQSDEAANSLGSSSKSEELPFRFSVRFSRNDVVFHKFYQDFSGGRTGSRQPEDDRLQLVQPEREQVVAKTFDSLDKLLDKVDHQPITIKVAEMKKPGQQLIICQGGLGGRGNRAFRSSTNQTPREAEYGTFGEKKIVILELRLLADLGLVGLPNAGKSTLLSRLTKARPKIANYPFTTIEPNLGVLLSSDGKKELVVADIPGLIEGASQGKGLGDRFLRHIHNCKSLLYVLFLEEEQVFAQGVSVDRKAQLLLEQLRLLQAELRTHHPELLEKPSVVALNKVDLYPVELVESAAKVFKENEINLLTFSGVTGEGLDEVKKQIFRLDLK